MTQHSCVIIPGVGAFLAHKVAAHYNAEDGVFTPPHRTLGFNPQVTIDDALLQSEYMESCGISYENACNAIAGDTEKLRQELSRTSVVRFGELGTFSMNIKGELSFVPSDNCIDDPYNYGFEPFAISQVSDLEKKDIVIKRRNIGKYASAVAAAIVALFVLFPVGSSVYEQSIEASVAKISPKEANVRTVASAIVVAEDEICEIAPVKETVTAATYEPALNEASLSHRTSVSKVAVAKAAVSAMDITATNVDSEMQTIEVVTTENIVENITLHPVAIEPEAEADNIQEALPIEENIAVQPLSTQYSIIVASTPNPEKAQLAITELTTKHKADYSVVEGDRRFRIAIESYHSNNEANNALNRVKEIFPDAWIYTH